MDATQLEQSTLRSYLFVAKLCSGDDIFLKERVHYFAIEPTTARQDWITYLNYIPGGRFVVTGSERGCLSVWDLGHQTREL